jgi:transcriptional regulator with XRE-family HTH domain
MRVMNDDPNASGAMPAETLAGRQLRLLRQGCDWSQKEVADRMSAYGYAWNQSTITRIESASRPLRLNELADLAAMFGVPVTHFLRPDPAPHDGDTLDAVEREIRSLLKDRMDAAVMVASARAAYTAAGQHLAEATHDMQLMDSRLQTLKLWHPGYDDIAGETLEEIAGATAAAKARRLVRAWTPEERSAAGITPERSREMNIESLLRPYAELLGEDQAEHFRPIFQKAVDAAMEDRDLEARRERA